MSDDNNVDFPPTVCNVVGLSACHPHSHSITLFISGAINASYSAPRNVNQISVIRDPRTVYIQAYLFHPHTTHRRVIDNMLELGTEKSFLMKIISSGFHSESLFHFQYHLRCGGLALPLRLLVPPEAHPFPPNGRRWKIFHRNPNLLKRF